MLAIFGVCLWITWSTLVVLVVMALMELDKVQKTYLIEWEKLNVNR